MRLLKILLHIIVSLLVLGWIYLSQVERYRDLAKCQQMLLQNKRYVVLSHNLAQGQVVPERVASVLNEVNPDIAFFQEVVQDQIDVFRHSMIEQFPVQVFGPLQGKNQAGMAIISKYPILKNEDFKLDLEGLVLQQRVEISLDNSKLVAYNIHTTFPWIRIRHQKNILGLPIPAYDSSIRDREIKELTRRFTHEESSIIAAGDFNLTPNSSSYELLNQYVSDSRLCNPLIKRQTWPADNTPSLTIPFAFPIFRIDYIFFSHDIYATKEKVLGKTGSDHLPIVAELRLSSNNAAK